MRRSKLVAFLAALLPAAACVGPGGPERGVPAGEYEVVALRRASDVEGGPEVGRAAAWLGARVTFGERLVWLDGVGCDAWSVRDLEPPPLALDDPNLSDLTISPLDSAGDHRIDRSIELLCEGRRVGALIVVDRRVLVTRGPAGLLNLILERPLTTGQIRELQLRLGGMQLYEGFVSGTIDDATRRAISRYAERRGARYGFRRAALTENLLDGLDVLTAR